MAAAYADWTFYDETYLGTAITEANFAALALRASATLDLITFNRVAVVIAADDDADTIELIKMATCAVADEMQRQSDEGPAVTSERVGQHSVSYATNPATKYTDDERLSRAAKTYLGNTALMFKGFANSEYGGQADED